MSDSYTMGPDSRVEQLLAKYDLGAESLLADAFESDVARLQAALLLEQRGDSYIEAVESDSDGEPDKTATYYSDEATIDSSSDEWEDLDLGFVAESWDLRVSNAAVQVAFADPTESEAVAVDYAPAESPIVGIPAESTSVWYRADPNASSDPTLDIQAWG